MTSRRVVGPKGWAGVALLGLGLTASAGQPAWAEPATAGPQLARPAAPAAPPRRVARAEAPPPPLCDGPGPRQAHRVLFNRADLEDPDAQPALQSAVQLCISAAPARDRASTRGPVWRG